MPNFVGRLLMVAAVMSAPLPATSWAQTAPAAPAAAAPETSDKATPVDNDYRLGPGDKIRLIVYGEDTLSGQFVVAGNGRVQLPLIGEVNAINLTVPEFQDAVDKALRQGYLREPRVSAEVLSYRPFYILGEVNKPGEYPYSSGLTVFNAVATAGGFTYRAQTKRVFIRKNDATKEEPVDLTSQTPVNPGDTIRITERFF